MNFLEKVKRYIGQLYPFYYADLRGVFVFTCVLTVSSFLFSFLFEPFQVNIAEHKINSLVILFIHASIPLPVSMLYFFVLKKRIIHIERWTLSREFVYLAILLFIIGICSFLIRDLIYTNPDNWSFRYLFEEIRNTFLVGLLILTIVLPLNLERLLHRHNLLSRALPSALERQDLNSSVYIKTAIPSEHFYLEIASFLYAKVEGNYTELIYGEESGTYRLVKRMSLGQLEQQLDSFPQLCRVHRSYLVNVQKVQAVSGNAQGYLLDLGVYGESKIPVSRSKILLFNRVYAPSV